MPSYCAFSRRAHPERAGAVVRGTTDPRALPYAWSSPNRDALAGGSFLSGPPRPKTVEYHLRRVFQTLGVSSRVEPARLRLGVEAVG